jgi:hypothetical protein
MRKLILGLLMAFALVSLVSATGCRGTGGGSSCGCG